MSVLAIRLRDGDAWLSQLFFATPVFFATPGESHGRHELYLMCDDVTAEVARLAEKDIEYGPISDQGWGLLTSIRLPCGGNLGLYEPCHASAHGTNE